MPSNHPYSMSKSNPPKWADWLVERICSPQFIEELQGDLHEAYQWRVEKHGIAKAKWLFIFEVFRSFQFLHLKPVSSMNRYLILYKNYFKTGWRFLKKHKLYSSLNILGLGLGISFCWLAYLYANDEMSFDTHLPDHELIYRIVSDFSRGDNTHHIGGSSHMMSIQFAEKIPEIEGVAKIQSDYGLIKKGEEVIGQSFIMADPEIIDYLNLTFLEGAPPPFDQPNDVIISESLAGKLDLSGKAIGQILSLSRGDDFEKFIIRAVYRDIPENTSIRKDMIMSYSNYLSTAKERRLTTWFDINMNSLVKLKNADGLIAAEKKMNEMHQENEPDGEQGSTVLKLQPISQIHLNKEYGHYNGISRGGNVEMIKLFAGIGIFCLLISMINYSNFNISLYINRAREVALRKVIGAEKSGIFSQLITESFISALLAGIIAFVLMLVLLTFFSAFVRKDYSIQYFMDAQFITGAIGILIGVAFLSGAYPAMVLSRFSIIKSLKGEQKIKSGKWITQTLLGLQFVIATVLVSGMLTMKDQIQYLTAFDTKIDYQDVIYIDYIRADENAVRAFVNDLSRMPEVASVAAISGYNGTNIRTEDMQLDIRHLRIENDLLGMLDIEILQGRNFDTEITSDQTQSVIVNETLVAKMGLESPIGETIPFNYGDLKNPKIIGVVEDYHFKSAKNAIDPLVIYTSPQYPLQSVYLKLSSSQFDTEKFENVWANHFDPFPFTYSFLEDEYKGAYENENRMMQLVAIGCFVSIFLAAMGLLGVVGLQLNQQLKEISIRKVLGATKSHLYQVFTRKFILVIMIGLIIGLFTGNYTISDWLNNYPFHVSFGLNSMSITVLITVSIAFITILSQVFKVIRKNPVQFLKDE